MAYSLQTMTADRRARQNEYDTQQNGDDAAPEVNGAGQPGQAGINAARGSGQVIVSHGASCMGSCLSYQDIPASYIAQSQSISGSDSV
jgi:hypothetical protein